MHAGAMQNYNKATTLENKVARPKFREKLSTPSMASNLRRGGIGGSLVARESTMSKREGRKSRVLDMATTAKMAVILSSLNKKELIFKQKMNQLMKKNLGSKQDFVRKG